MLKLMSSPRVAKAPSRRKHPRRGGSARLRHAHRWGKRARWVGAKLAATPPAVRIGAAIVTMLALFAAANLIYHVIRKPTEMFFPVSHALNKMPADTWRQYGPLFREYSTSTIPPELLAALAQVEGAGNPVARTYWRWRLTWHPFGIYEPASSAVGMYQITDAAFADARRYCIRRHTVVEDGCWFNGLYSRVMPSHAIELTAALLDRGVATVLARQPGMKPSPQQAQDLATLIHLCGTGPAQGFARRGFHLAPDERCGDQLVANYLAKVNAAKRQFLRLAAAP
jgi:hypothetical protein